MGKVDSRTELAQQILWQIQQDTTKLIDIENAMSEHLRGTTRGVLDPAAPDFAVLKDGLDVLRIQLRERLLHFSAMMGLDLQLATTDYLDRLRRINDLSAKARGDK